MREATQKLGISVVGPPLAPPILEVEHRRVIAIMAQEGVDALMVGSGPEHYTHRQLIVELAEKDRLPAIYAWREGVEIGGLLAYASNIAELYRHAADQIDQILGGAKPGEVPYELATKFELVINLRTAKALGLTIPASLLARADEVIE
jgi:putative ABC transport system substrate-binding protein